MILRMRSMRTFFQSWFSFSFFISQKLFVVTDLNIDGSVGGLLVEEVSNESLVLRSAGHEDASFAVAGFRSAVNADSGSSGNVNEERHEGAEFGRYIDLQFIDECGYEVVFVLKRSCNGSKVLFVLAA